MCAARGYFQTGTSADLSDFHTPHKESGSETNRPVKLDMDLFLFHYPSQEQEITDRLHYNLPKTMHHALQIDEIFLTLLTHCNAPLFKNYRHGRPTGVTSDLFALARTCRTFKEPALDALWSELSDLSPLAGCLPGVSYQMIPGFKVRSFLVLIALDLVNDVIKWYSFRRSLGQAEWDTLRSYTRRVRSILDFGSAFHPDCVRTFLNPPDSELLFPNLRYLRCTFANEVTPLLHQFLPSLISLDYSFVFEGNLPLLRESLESFPRVSPNMKELSIRVHQPEVTFDKLVSDYICRWSNPQIVYCPQIVLDVNALSHLSRVPRLTQLTLTLSAEITPSDILLFSMLHELKLFSESLIAVSRLLTHARLPILTDFTVEISSYPSKQNITAFLTALRPSRISDSIMKLKLTQIHHSLSVPRPDPLVLTADDLRPSTALRNLRRLDFNLGWSVGLTDSQLLELAPAWPHLECLLINEEWGWQTLGGITPDGLVRLLQTCRSLTRIALAVDTRGYTDVPLPRLPASLGLDYLPPSFSLNVVDSVIDAACVPAMAAFFANMVSSPRFSLRAWSSWAFTWRMNKKAYTDRWNEVYARAGEVVARRCIGSG